MNFTIVWSIILREVCFKMADSMCKVCILRLLDDFTIHKLHRTKGVKICSQKIHVIHNFSR